MRPSVYCSSISATSFFASSSRTSFDGGMTMSSRQIEMPALRRVRVAGRPQCVREEHRGLLAALAIDEVDQLGELLLAHHRLIASNGICGGQMSLEQRAADGGRHELACRPCRRLSMRSLIAAWRWTSPWSYAMRTSSIEPNTPRTARPFLSSRYSPRANGRSRVRL